MDVTEIKERMRSRGFKQAELARLLGLDQPTVSKALSGVRQFKVAEMDKIRTWLADEFEGPAARAIPYIGEVAAGNWREAVQRSTMSMPAPDPTIPRNAFALKVTGDSMDLLVEDGGTVIVDPDDKALYPGRFYVVLNSEGETTFKKFAPDPARLIPCSSNPAHEEIELGSGEAFRVVGRVIWRASRM